MTLEAPGDLPSRIHVSLLPRPAKASTPCLALPLLKPPRSPLLPSSLPPSLVLWEYKSSHRGSHVAYHTMHQPRSNPAQTPTPSISFFCSSAVNTHWLFLPRAASVQRGPENKLTQSLRRSWGSLKLQPCMYNQQPQGPSRAGCWGGGRVQVKQRAQGRRKQQG